jgi:tetratricopeptide (TPR) repeat protein
MALLGFLQKTASARPLLFAAFLGGVAFAVFLPAVRGGFVDFDDGPYVAENPWVLTGLTAAGIQRACTEVVCGNWSPLTMLSYELDASIFGPEPWGFHLTNVILHAVATGLFYIVLQRMTGRPIASAVAAVLFSIHPLRAESVAWIAERKDVLCQVFLMLALLAYERYCRAASIARYAVIMVAMALGLLSKPTLVTLPLLLLLVDIWPLGRFLPNAVAPAAGNMPGTNTHPYGRSRWTTLVIEKLPLCGLSLVFVMATLAAQQVAMRGGIEKPFFSCRLPNAAYALTWYVTAFFWPTHLCIMRRHLGDELSLAAVGACVAAIALVVAAAVAFRRTWPWFSFGIAWLFVALLPMLGLVQVGEQGYADRYSYVPHVGLIVAVVWSLAWIADRLRMPVWLRAAAIATTALALIGLTERQIATWRDSETLWNHALLVDPRIALAHTKLGTRRLAAGDLIAAKRHYLAAFEAGGGTDNVSARLAGVHFDLGEFDEARRLRDRAISITPDGEYTSWIVKKMRVGIPTQISDEIRALLRQGLAEARAGRFAEALTVFERACDIDPACGDAHNNRGMALAQLGRDKEAIEAFERAVDINPLHADYRLNLARTCHTLKRPQEALAHSRAAVACDPTDDAIRSFFEALVSSADSAPDVPP